MPQLIGLGRHSALLVDMAPVSAVTNASRWWRRDRRAPSEVAFLHCALASCGAVYCNRFCLWVCDSGRAVPEPYYSQRARAAQCLRLSERFFMFACICQNSGLECSTGMWRREFPGSYGNPAGRKRGAEMKTQLVRVYTVDLFFLLRTAVRKTKNDLSYRFPHFLPRFECEN